MHWLTALAAFAATMFMLSIIVSVMTEMVHRIRRSRLKSLRKMLEKLFEHSIRLRITEAARAKMNGAQFAALILENRAANSAAGSGDSVVAEAPKRLDELDRISEEVFAQKLADLRLEFMETDPGKLKSVAEDIVARFVTFGSEMSVAFERRARLISVVCAFILAIVAYVHPYNIAKVYLLDEDLAQQVAAAGLGLETELANIEEMTRNLAQQSGSEGVKALEETQAALDTLNQKLDALKGHGVPIGWPTATEACGLPIRAVENCIVAGVTIPSALNLFWLLFGGLLVGLGAPFWKQIIETATRSNEVTQRLMSIVGGVSSATTPAAAAAPAVASAQSTAVNVFELARSVGGTQVRKAPSDPPGA